MGVLGISRHKTHTTQAGEIAVISARATIIKIVAVGDDIDNHQVLLLPTLAASAGNRPDDTRQLLSFLNNLPPY